MRWSFVGFAILRVEIFIFTAIIAFNAKNLNSYIFSPHSPQILPFLLILALTPRPGYAVSLKVCQNSFWLINAHFSTKRHSFFVCRQRRKMCMTSHMTENLKKRAIEIVIPGRDGPANDFSLNPSIYVTFVTTFCNSHLRNQKHTTIWKTAYNNICATRELLKANQVKIHDPAQLIHLFLFTSSNSVTAQKNKKCLQSHYHEK